LELECSSLIPDTWEEYLGKLEEGQQMKDRPDLMFELGQLLNKAKSDRLQKVCVELKLAPDLWQSYQDKLFDDQQLRDRPELINALNTDLGKRSAQILKESTKICPPEIWQSYEQRTDGGALGKQELSDRPDLLDELARELGFSDMLAAVAACLAAGAGGGGSGSGGGTGTVAGNAVIDVDATNVEGVKEIRRNENQWDE